MLWQVACLHASSIFELGKYLQRERDRERVGKKEKESRETESEKKIEREKKKGDKREETKKTNEQYDNINIFRRFHKVTIMRLKRYLEKKRGLI